MKELVQHEPAPKTGKIVVRARALEPLYLFHDRVRMKHKQVCGQQSFESIDAYMREGRRRFGPDKLSWHYWCHHCQSAFMVADYIQVKAPTAQIGHACIGAFLPSHPCQFTGTNKLPGNPISVRAPGGVTARMLAFLER